MGKIIFTLTLLLVSTGVFAQLTVSINANPDTICAGSSTTLTANVTGGAMPYSYTWSNIQTTSAITVAPTVTTTYTITVSDNNSTTNTAQTIVVVSPPVTLSASQTPTNCFPNGSVTANILTGTAPFSYTWNTIPPQYTASAMNLDSGEYCVTAIDSKGCSNTTCVTILANNPLSISMSSTPEHCENMDGTASGNVSGGNPGLYTYYWDNGETTKTITQLSSGYYTITVSNGSCQISDSVYVADSCNRVKEINTNNNSIKVFPNPANEVIYIKYDLKECKTGYVEIYNSVGTKIESFVLETNKNSITINISNIKSGVYYYKVISNERVICFEKLVVIRI
jgi:hypothetical protein